MVDEILFGNFVFREMKDGRWKTTKVEMSLDAKVRVVLYSGRDVVDRAQASVHSQKALADDPCGSDFQNAIGQTSM